MNTAPSATPAILIVEPDADIREVLVAVLSEAGYRVTTTATVAAGIAALGQAAFNLVLTNNFSVAPDPSFAAIAGLLQAAGGTPVVLVTAHRFDDVQVHAAGLRTVIEKPFNIDDLIRRLDTLLHGG